MYRVIEKIVVPVATTYGGHSGIDILPANSNVHYVTAHSNGEIDRIHYFKKNIYNNSTPLSHPNDSYGMMVRIKHPNGYCTLYAHMADFSKQWKLIKKINKGDRIGIMGNTGNSSGRHLHFEVWTNSSTRILDFNALELSN